MAPWGQKRAQEEERKAELAAREEGIRHREELLTPTRKISISNTQRGDTTNNNNPEFGDAANEGENQA